MMFTQEQRKNQLKKLPEFVHQFRNEDNVKKLGPQDDGEISGDLFDNIGTTPILSPSLLTLEEEIGKWKVASDMQLRVAGDGKFRYNNPCDWWRVNRAKLPILASVAQIVKFLLFMAKSNEIVDTIFVGFGGASNVGVFFSCGKYCDRETNPFDSKSRRTADFFSYELGSFSRGERK